MYDTQILVAIPNHQSLTNLRKPKCLPSPGTPSAAKKLTAMRGPGVITAIALAGAVAVSAPATAAPALAPHLPIVVAIHAHVEAKLVAIADRVAVRAPDVRVLTTEPVAPADMKGA